jgi:hypothetical protein
MSDSEASKVRKINYTWRIRCHPGTSRVINGQRRELVGAVAVGGDQLHVGRVIAAHDEGHVASKGYKQKSFYFVSLL